MSVFYLSVDGIDVTSNFLPVLETLTITDHAGGKADTLEATLSDTDGMLVFPRIGAAISGGIARNPGEVPIAFDGFVDEPQSTGARGQGRILSIHAKSADMRGKLKATQDRHKDDASFQDAAQEFARDAGLQLRIDPSLGSVFRDYWAMHNEDFLAWGFRIAGELGATFKVMGQTGVFVARNSGMSASGKALATITARAGEGGNLISWSLAPRASRPAFQSFDVRWYDPKAAKFMRQTVQAQGQGGSGFDAALTDRFMHADQDHAQRRAGSNSKESDRDKGGGSITIDGDPAAQAEANCIVEGARPAMDGVYRIDTATHHYTRGGGYVTQCELKQPDGAAGTDGR